MKDQMAVPNLVQPTSGSLFQTPVSKKISLYAYNWQVVKKYFSFFYYLHGMCRIRKPFMLSKFFERSYQLTTDLGGRVAKRCRVFAPGLVIMFMTFLIS